jgi:hypothetical protein
VSELQRWLATLDPAAIAETVRHGSLRAAPSRDIVADDWVLRFTPIPVDSDKRGNLTGPMIGIGHVETSRSDPTAAVRKALREKGRRYGSLHPLVVALDLEEFGIETGDIAAALFGRVVNQLSGGTEPRIIGERRDDDGYWSARRNAGARVAAVLTVATPRPWNVADLIPRLWINPWAPHPYAGPRLWDWVTVDPHTGQFVEGPSEATTAHLLGLAPGWPPGQPFE